uniref:Uncharacterized protein n=1 Tax=Arion vulgaris TaxID=1028688 RepID=A0A0B7BBX9_9EUPU
MRKTNEGCNPEHLSEKHRPVFRLRSPQAHHPVCDTYRISCIAEVDHRRII